ncbi:hypothetical protein VE04_00218 [Pseudogymnoascus sp. 24MN13]|nr:hypothetical protein VE04_00218 [Pseudogymnoascus sp. 24MN13]
MNLLHFFAGSVLVRLAFALPQPQAGITTAASELCTKTVTSLGIDHTVTDYKSWASSVNSVQGSASKTGSQISAHTTAFNFPGLGLITAYNFEDSHVLTSAGYKIIINTYTITGACPTTTVVIPPSPTAGDCTLHGDHWHCSSVNPTETAAPTCVAHDDHWDCPAGVPEPTTPPPTSTSISSDTSTTAPISEGECVAHAHGDHWDCPAGVPEPTTPPGGATGGTIPPFTGDECVAHGDHWDCPAGVLKPSTPPGSTPTATASETTSGECVAHGDHWHCPDGVPEPATPPPAVPTTLATLTNTNPSATTTGCAYFFRRSCCAQWSYVGGFWSWCWIRCAVCCVAMSKETVVGGISCFETASSLTIATISPSRFISDISVLL